MSKRIIAIGSDHAAFELKEALKAFLEQHQYEVKDFGCYNQDSVDYPDVGLEVANYVANNLENIEGVLLCGSGIGMSIVANRVRGIRAALCHNPVYAELSRKHNNSNILVLGGRFLNRVEAEQILDTWLKTEFEGARHAKRVNKIDAMLS